MTPLLKSSQLKVLLNEVDTLVLEIIVSVKVKSLVKSNLEQGLKRWLGRVEGKKLNVNYFRTESVNIDFSTPRHCKIEDSPLV